MKIQAEIGQNLNNPINNLPRLRLMEGLNNHAVVLYNKEVMHSRSPEGHLKNNFSVQLMLLRGVKMEEVAIIWNLSHTTDKIWKNTIKNDKNHKKINNQLNNFKAEIGKSAKQLQAEPKKMGCL